MKKLIITLSAALLLIGCTNEKEQNITYQMFLDDIELVKEIKETPSCEEKIKLFEKIKTIDGKSKLRQTMEECDVTVEVIAMKENPTIEVGFTEIMELDQEVRHTEPPKMYQEALVKFENNEITEEEFFLIHTKVEKELLNEADSINFKKFDELVASIGEWPGAEYFEIAPYEPKLSVLVAHMPEEDYKRYTLMAYESAKQGKEYWMKFTTMFGFSFKHRVSENNEPLKTFTDGVIPFMFTEFSKNNTINEQSDLTQIEFDYFKKIRFEEESLFVLSSSYDSLEKRKDVLQQAQELLIKRGLDRSLIEIDLNKIQNEDYRLFYKTRKI